MNPLNLMQHFDVNTLPTALQRGLAMLRDPKQTWPLVRADNTAWPALLMGYALWWVLWAVLGALAVVLVSLGFMGMGFGLKMQLGDGFGTSGWLFAIGAAAWAVVPQFFSWFAAVGLLVFGVMMSANSQIRDGASKSQSRQRVLLMLHRALQLVVHAMTPVWLLAPLMVLPVLGGWVLWAGIGWGLYCAWLGLGEITDLPPQEHASAMVVLAISALLAVTLFSALGWLALVGCVIVLFVMGQAKWAVESDSSDAGVANVTDTTDTTNASNTVSEGPSQNAPASPEYEFNLAPATTTTATAASTAADAKKIADLDKKIAKATGQGDMALVSRLMGERGVLQQGHNPDF